jgi:hypothetical protein
MARIKVYLRLTTLCILCAACHVLYLANMLFSQCFPALPLALCVTLLVTLLFVGYCVVKPAARTSSVSVGSAFIAICCLSVPALFVVYPTILVVKTANERGQLKERLKTIGAAMYAYHAHEHHLPAPAIYSKDGTPLLSWRVALLPYLGYQDLFQRFNLDQPWDSGHNRGLASQMPLVYSLPVYLADGVGGDTTHFHVYVGPGAAFEKNRELTFNDFPKGTDKTVLVVLAPESVPWTKPTDLQFAPSGTFTTPDPFLGQTYVLFVDGSVDRRGSLTADEWRALITRKAGQPPFGR